MFRQCKIALILPLLLCLYCKGKSALNTDTSFLPAKFQQELKKCRQKDDLAAWLYARIDYAEEAPASRIDFLMNTQKEAWRSYRNLPEREAWFNLLILQGYHLLQTGNMLASIQAYENAMEFYDAYPIADTDEYVEYVLKPLGNNYTRLADYDAAFYIHQKTLQLLKKAPVTKELAGVYANLATCARWKGELNTAATYCRLGLDIADNNSALYGLLLNTYADILLQQNKIDSALEFSTNALDQLKNWNTRFKSVSQSASWYIAALQLNARLLLADQQSTEAYERCRDAMEIQNRNFPDSKQREKAKLLVLAGDILLKENRASEAMDQYQRAMQLLLPAWKPAHISEVPPDSLLYSENTFTDALAGKAAAMAIMQYKDIALEHYFAVFRAARKLRDALSYTSSRIRDMQLLRERSEAAMELAWDLQQKSPASLQYKNKLLLITELSKAQVLQDERMMRYTYTNQYRPSDSLFLRQKRLQEAVIYYQHELTEARTAEKARIRDLLREAEYELVLLQKQSGISAIPSSGLLTLDGLEKLYESLPADLQMISFFNGKKYSYLIRFNNNGVQEMQQLSGSERLGITVMNFASKWFGKGADEMINQPDLYCQESFEIYQLLFGKMQLNQMSRCILLPDGVFSYLPFDALVTGPCENKSAANWAYFSRKTILSQAWSLQTWYDQQQTNYTRGYFMGWFVGKSQNRFLPELSVEKEQKWLQRKIPGRFYLNEAANWNSFRQEVDSAYVLHIGAHAVAARENNFPYLQLYDQPFYLFDLKYKHFAPSLVWLGACRTGDGSLVEGEGVNSLSRAFTAAGAGGVVAGMWNVNDNASTEIMQLFYQQIADGEDAATALHSAKEEYLRNHRNENILQLPYYWAGFTYSGHLQSIQLFGEISITAWILAAVGVAILLLFFWWFFKKVYK